MNRNRMVFPFAVVLILIGLTACNMPIASTPAATQTQTAQGPASAYTAAAQTIAAQLTQISNPSSPTPTNQGTEASVLGTVSPVTEALASPAAVTELTASPSAETPTPESSPTIEETAGGPTPTPGPTATLPSGDPKASLGEPTFRDTFTNGNNWALYVDRNAAFEVKGGNLLMTSYSLGSRNSWMLTQPRPLNYYLEVTAEPQACSGKDRYGVIFRSADATTGYLFTFSCDGQYSLKKWDGKRATTLVDWTASSAILPGSNQVNRLGLRVVGSQFSLYANGNLLTELSDPSYSKGGFGLLIGGQNTQDFTVAVKEVDYWELP